jgi:hypothetical protein
LDVQAIKNPPSLPRSSPHRCIGAAAIRGKMIAFLKLPKKIEVEE